MDVSIGVSGVNLRRTMERIERLAHVSAGSGPGVTRLPFTAAGEQANMLVGQWMEEAGMLVRRDEVSNLIGRYEGTLAGAPVLMIGSHLDTAIEAGKYDGVLGVIGSVEVVQGLFESGIRLKHPVETVSFCDEEGVRFRTALVGSRAMAGTLSRQDLQATDDEGITLAEAMRQYGLDPDQFGSAARSPGSLLGYLELHIEQGPILEHQNQPCGVVTGIAGAARYMFCVEGIPGHAGTVPMSLRHDALVGAAELILAVQRVARQHEPLVATVGKLSVRPGATNVIPGLVEGTLDIRDVDDTRRHTVAELLLAECRTIGERQGVICHFEKTSESPAAFCSPKFIDVIEAALRPQGIVPTRLISGAGHDAMAMARVTDIGMIFVRSKGGLSHHPAEETSPEDIEKAIQVLRSVVLELG